MTEIRYPTIEQIDRLHIEILRTTGGEHGYLSRSNFQFILNAVQEIGEELPVREAVILKAAYLRYNQVIQHPFVNGNKRTAYEVVKLFLDLNGYNLRPDLDEAYSFVLDIAMGKVSRDQVDSNQFRRELIQTL
jgi:death-on-curing protein